MRVNAAAVAGAVVATAAAILDGAAHPAQFVVAIAAGCAFLAVLSRGRQAAASDWFTVQVLLAGNLCVFGISEEHRLGAALAVVVVVAGALLMVAAIWMYWRWPGGAGRGR